MGIKYLNRYLKNHCSRGIQYISIDRLSNKTIVVDTSIYIYRFLETNSLLENFFTFITQCHAFQITPLFVFDGKPDDSKLQTIKERHQKRKDAMIDYYQCKSELENNTLSDTEKDKLILKMEQLKKDSTRVKEKHIAQVKQLFDAMKVSYWEASGEADILCAYLVKRKMAWACVSDDMDMFVYDCDFVIREWNIEKQQCILYDRNRIIRELNIDYKYFSAVLVILGTDYHQESNNSERIYIDTALKWYDQYYYDTIHPDNHHHSDITNNDCSTVDTCHCHYEDFYKWLADNGKITMENREKLSKIYSIFIIPDTLDIRQLSNNNCYPHKETIIQWDAVKNILTPLGFLFPTNII
jgi:hypothetical protein